MNAERLWKGFLSKSKTQMSQRLTTAKVTTSFANHTKVPAEKRSQVNNEALKLLKKYVFHPEWHSKRFQVFPKWRISVTKKPTYKEGSWSRHIPHIYVHFHLCRGWHFTQVHDFCNTVVLWYLSPFFLENLFCIHNKFLHKWLMGTIQAGQNYTGQVNVRSRINFSPVPCDTSWVWVYWGLWKCNIWKDLALHIGISKCTAKTKHQRMIPRLMYQKKHWAGNYPGNHWASTNQLLLHSKKSMPIGWTQIENRACA